MANRFCATATAAVVLLSLGGFPQAAFAQPYPPNPYRHMPPPQFPPRPVTLDGTVLSISSSEIDVMVSPSGKGHRRGPRGKWAVLTQAKTAFTVTGEAKADYLKPGLTVRFNAENAAGTETLQDKISELTIVALPHSKPQPAPAKKVQAATVKAPDLSDESAVTEVVGHLGRSSEKQWMVRARGKPLHFDLADDAKIKVSVHDGRLIAVGDKVLVHGEMTRFGSCVADDMKVTLAKPLSGAKKKPPATAEKKKAVKEEGEKAEEEATF
jgi:hypothetical protein